MGGADPPTLHVQSHNGEFIAMSNDPKAIFAQMSLAEKILAVAALVGVIAWFVARTPWSYTWFGKTCIIGMGLVLALTASTIFGVKVLEESQRKLALIVAGLAPLAGFLLDMAKGRGSELLLFGAAVAMAYAVGLLTGKVAR
jgi:hypothetical protein